MMDMYTLDENGHPVRVKALRDWARWFEDFTHRQLARDRTGDFEVSTVFLGIDHNHTGMGNPVLWESCSWDNSKPMVIDMGGVPHETCESNVERRYSSRAAALKGHAEILAECREVMRERVAKRKARKAKK